MLLQIYTSLKMYAQVFFYNFCILIENKSFFKFSKTSCFSVYKNKLILNLRKPENISVGFHQNMAIDYYCHRLPYVLI